ncbi:hypothetical protein AWJ20_5142 [Sugiyamaella lignohabitans]|uniref:Proteasome activator Blm10 N-terminal domain-containing protein n=1 Tax=Sugiyamaella lignohabitans TaxID=796027 RepID=A0A167EKH5_9ASCO|nr:uncharacterized protein AWJ20_5142 [Sugiyamaella lignohabitans]ANB14183.1 hypothetical protein AWJ20_5142 [Sugiyamaella lignohabitans]
MTPSTDLGEGKVIAKGNSFRSRPRTFPYISALPYECETQEERLEHLDHIIANLYIAIKGDDLKGIIGNSTGPAVYHWTKELRSWISLKFDMPLETRIKLIKLYYSLALAGTDGAAMEKFINMFCLLCKDDLFQDTVKPQDLDLDWRTLVVVMRKLAFPQQSSYEGSISKSFSALSRLAQVARHLIKPELTLQILEEILPHVSLPCQNDFGCSSNLSPPHARLERSERSRGVWGGAPAAGGIADQELTKEVCRFEGKCIPQCYEFADSAYACCASRGR